MWPKGVLPARISQNERQGTESVFDPNAGGGGWAGGIMFTWQAFYFPSVGPEACMPLLLPLPSLGSVAGQARELHGHGNDGGGLGGSEISVGLLSAAAAELFQEKRSYRPYMQCV